VTKYFYRCQPPTPAKELLAELWRLEKEAEKLLDHIIFNRTGYFSFLEEGKL
jgi:DNA repair protein RadC